MKGNKLYKLHYNVKLSTRNNVKHATIFQETSSIDLWHQIFGHLNANSLKVISKEKLVEGLSINNKTKLSSCESYVQAKQHIPTFPKERGLQTTKLLSLIHSNIWGLTKTPSLTRVKYFLSYIDNFLWIFFCKFF